MSPDEVARRRPLPRGTGRGKLRVTADVIVGTRETLRASRGPDGRHEGLVFWAGRELQGLTVITLALAPETDHGWGHVRASEASVAESSRIARSAGLGILVQVHSHPSSDTRHSEGDDSRILLPFEGMFSLVVGRYGDGSFDPWAGLGIHQFQDGRWVLVTNGRDVFEVAETDPDGDR